MTITSAPAPTRPARRAVGTAAVWLLVLPSLVWAAIRLAGVERGPVVQVLAFTPYAAAAAWLPVLVALLVRRWATAAVGLVVAATLAACVLPRAVADGDRGPQAGVPLHVMTANMLAGGADAATIVRLIRQHDVAVLALQEYTPQARARLSAAGLDALLPYGSQAPEVGTTGSALYSRFPVSAPGSHRGGGGFLQAYATVRPPGTAPLAVESAHPVAPYAVGVLADWRADLSSEPRADPDGPARILLGDFNSTVDHAPLRALISHGYRDAADAVGQGLAGTWGPYGGHPIPPVTIDHILVDRRIGVRDLRVHGLPGSDHRAVLASLVLPRA
ncbi:endonuclease/exonuclease/phosphatase family protein [Mangrovihabitans endophyticus]|uniref:Endonuclease n=1 Tax=Mangrovihabitans endophyticus TaxID=1751298 RepID=A0A8J3C382_9ACTN|nr:endonuclease/exonuclease/phosphatase family protein [Mangrovihabitans endophyticus]GGL11052.1 endonuclease [Mangrovihabitans endophyticus]